MYLNNINKNYSYQFEIKQWINSKNGVTRNDQLLHKIDNTYSIQYNTTQLNPCCEQSNIPELTELIKVY